MKKRFLVALLLMGLMIGGSAASASASSFERCTAYNRFCQFQAPGWNTRLQSYLGWLRELRCERFPATCPRVWQP